METNYWVILISILLCLLTYMIQSETIKVKMKKQIIVVSILLIILSIAYLVFMAGKAYLYLSQSN
jgi:hypothetical protein